MYGILGLSRKFCTVIAPNHHNYLPNAHILIFCSAQNLGLVKASFVTEGSSENSNLRYLRVDYHARNVLSTL
jgi:hypothetical protein